MRANVIHSAGAARSPFPPGLVLNSSPLSFRSVSRPPLAAELRVAISGPGPVSTRDTIIFEISNVRAHRELCKVNVRTSPSSCVCSNGAQGRRLVFLKEDLCTLNYTGERGHEAVALWERAILIILDTLE